MFFRGRRGVTLATVFAAAVLATAGVGAVVFYSSLSGANGPSISTSSLSGNFTTLHSTTTYLPPISSSSTTTTFTTAVATLPTTSSSSGSTGWQEWAVLNATLGYFKTQEYIHDAWNYTFNVIQTATNGNLVFIAGYVGAIGPLKVTGNWSAGYTLNYTRTSWMNVTVQYTPGSNYYPVIFFNGHNNTGILENIQFNSTQQKAISIALASSEMQSFTSQYPTFVDAARVFPSGNTTFGGDYLISVFQINGPKTLNAFVDLRTDTVVSTYNSTRAIQVCFSGGACFTSPWPA